MKEEIDTYISFADSEFSSYLYCEDTDMLMLRIYNYGLRTFEIYFPNPIFFSDRGEKYFHEFWKDDSMTSVLSEALLHKYGKIPDEHPYQMFQILSIYYEPAIEIVAPRFEIIYRERNGDLIKHQKGQIDR